MTPEHKKHLQSLIDYFSQEVSTKYEKGVKEHGGNLWEKDGLLDEAIMEAIDLVVYLVTLKQQ